LFSSDTRRGGEEEEAPPLGGGYLRRGDIDLNAGAQPAHTHAHTHMQNTLGFTGASKRKIGTKTGFK